MSPDSYQNYPLPPCPCGDPASGPCEVCAGYRQEQKNSSGGSGQQPDAADSTKPNDDRGASPMFPGAAGTPPSGRQEQLPPRFDWDHTGTHYADCWKQHPACAYAFGYQEGKDSLEAENTRLNSVIDRQNEAIDDLMRQDTDSDVCPRIQCQGFAKRMWAALRLAKAQRDRAILKYQLHTKTHWHPDKDGEYVI